MKDWHTHVFTSTYTADVSGVCSVMYELGGMSILHDPSGCNSTYTTHDEPRWFDTDSLMYVSGLDETAAIYGDDQYLIQDVIQAAEDLHPRFITLCGASIPHIIAFDYKGVAHLIEEATGIPVIPVATDGLKSYVSGVGLAAREWIRRFADIACEKKKNTVNLLGVTPIDFSRQEIVDEMKERIAETGYEINCCFAMGDSFDHLVNVYAAEANICVSSAGRIPARFMLGKAGIPYIEGVPLGPYMKRRIQESIALAIKENKPVQAYDNTAGTGDILVIGEEIFAKSLASEINHSTYAMTRHLSAAALWPDVSEGLDEDDLIQMMHQSKICICDPLFSNICKGTDTKLLGFPHEGYSGRIYRNEIINFCAEDFDINQLLEGAYSR